VCILNYLLYNKKINQAQIGGIILAFMGILLAVNGKSIYHMINPDYVFTSDFKNYRSDNQAVKLAVSGILLVFVIFWAYAILITKKN
jgi:hypothetical protein